MRWDQPGVETEIDLSALDQLALCTPGACPQEALDAGAVYYRDLGYLIAYYDQYGRLVGTTSYGQGNQIADSDSSMQTVASGSSFTPAGELQDIDQSLPGATPGAFEVTPAGAATYSIPLDIPPGTAGVQPQLALSYSSQGGNGLLGIGWSLEGVSAITRCPQTYAQDNNLTGLNFTGTDRFCLDGKRLMRTGGESPYDANESEYRTEIDTFSKVTAYGDQGTGPRWFQVRTKSGEIMQYGNTSDSNIIAENHAAAGAWALNRVTDTAGNYFDIVYVNVPGGGEYRPSRIEYTGKASGAAPYATIGFAYEERPDESVGFRANSRLATTTRLKTVIIKVNERIVRTYNMLYEATTGAEPLSRLAHVQMCVNGAPPSQETYAPQCLPETSFTWDIYPSGFDGVTNNQISADRVHERTFTMDANGDGRDDIVYEYNGEWHILVANPATRGFAYSSTGLSTPSGKVAVFDYNGDGLQDLAELPGGCAATAIPPVSCPTAAVTVLKSNGTGFTRVSTDIDYAGARSFTGIRTGDLNGDGRNDLVIGESGGLVIYLNQGASFTRHETGLGAEWAEGLRALEFDGDGRTDFMRLTGGVWYVLKSGAGGMSFQLINSGITQQALQLADVNGDGLQDVVVDSAGKFAIRLNRGGAFSNLVLTDISTGADAASLNYALVLDFNADGRQDLYAPMAGMWQALRSTTLGDGFSLPPTSVAEQGYLNSPQVGDFDGDGLVDVALDFSGTWHMLYHRPGNSGHITGINAGGRQYNDPVTVTYSALTAGPSIYNLTVDRLDPDLPDTRGIEAPLYVVSSYRRNNGQVNAQGASVTREYTYRYTDAMINFAGRGFLGFGTQSVTDATANLRTVTSYRQDFPYTGLVNNVVTQLVDGATPLSTATNTYAQIGVTPFSWTVYGLGFKPDVVAVVG